MGALTHVTVRCGKCAEPMCVSVSVGAPVPCTTVDGERVAVVTLEIEDIAAVLARHHCRPQTRPRTSRPILASHPVQPSRPVVGP